MLFFYSCMILFFFPLFYRSMILLFYNSSILLCSILKFGVAFLRWFENVLVLEHEVTIRTYWDIKILRYYAIKMQLARTYKTYETTKSLKRERSLFEPTCQNSLNFRIAFKVSVNNPLDVSARICVFRCQKRFQLRHQSNCGKHDFS